MTSVNTELVSRGNLRYLVALMPSSTPGKNYRTDVTNGRCDCAAWKFSKSVNGVRPPCKHLRELGFTSLVQSQSIAASPKPSKPKAPPVVYPAGYLENL